MTLVKVFFLFLCSSLFWVSYSKDNETNATASIKPSVKIIDGQVIRKNTSQAIQFDVTLSTSFAQQVSVEYTTISGIEKSDEDSKPKTDTLTFKPSETKSHINVPTLVDSLRQPPKSFTYN